MTEGGEQLVRLEQQLLEALQGAKNRLKELDKKLRDLNDSAKELIIGNDGGVQDEVLEQIKNQIASVKVSRDLFQEKYSRTISEINDYQGIVFQDKKKGSRKTL